MTLKTRLSYLRRFVLALVLCAGFLPSITQPSLAAQDRPEVAPTVSRRPSAALQAGLGFEPAACMFNLPVGVTEGAQVQCGYLTVPRDYQDEKQGTLRLAVAILKATGSQPEPDPLVMAQGGPGGSTIDTYGQMMFTSPLLQKRDIILFDQRGTLYSQPSLYCTEMDEMTARTIEQNLTPEENNRLNLEAMTACRQRLVQQGIDLSDFNSLENAEDIEQLRQALGYQQINLYGVSYGTQLAQHYMRLHPESLRSVILDAVVPLDTNFILNAAKTLDRALTHLFEACKADAACNNEFPDLEQVFFKVVEQLNEQPALVELRDYDTNTLYPKAVINGDTFQWLVFQLLYSGDVIPLLPRMIYDAQNGDFQVASAIMPLLVFDHSMSYGMYYSVLCAEDGDFSPADQDLAGVRPQIAKSEADDPQTMLDVCKMWNVEALDSSVDNPVTSAVPTLLLSGAFDPITPAPYAEQVARGLPNSFSLVFPAGGHGQMVMNKCADGIVEAFLDNPGLSPDAACLADKPAPTFVTRESVVKLPALYKAIQGDMTTLLLFLFLGLGLMFLGTALLVFPLAWLVNRLSRPARRSAESSSGLTPQGSGADGPVWQTDGDPFDPAPRPAAIDRLISWLPIAAATALGLFLIILLVSAVQMIAGNDNRIFYGLGSETRPWFVLPLVFVGLSLLMLAGAARLWTRRWASVPRKLYYTLLALTAFGSSLVMGWLGILRAFFA